MEEDKKEKTKTVNDKNKKNQKEVGNKKNLLEAIDRRIGDLQLQNEMVPYSESNLLRLKISNPETSDKVDMAIYTIKKEMEETKKQLEFLEDKKKQIQG